MTANLRIEIVRHATGPRPAGTSAHNTALVSAQRARAVEAAHELVANATAAAAQHVEAAHAEADQIRDAARREGAVEGERAWAVAAAAFAGRHDAMVRNLERDCATLALEIARQLFGLAIALDRGLVDELARRACAPLRRDGVLVLRVSPVDTDRIAALEPSLSTAGPVAIEVDPALASGECVAECGGVRVDGRLDVQLAAVERRLLGAAAAEVVV